MVDVDTPSITQGDCHEERRPRSFIASEALFGVPYLSGVVQIDPAEFGVAWVSQHCAGSGTTAPLGAVSFQEFVERDWLPSKHIEATTRAAYVSNLDKHFFPFFGHRPIAKITPSLVQDWVTHAAAGGSRPARSASTTRCCTRSSNEPSATSSS